VILELGANDGLRALSPTQTRKNLTAIIENLQGKNIKILFTGMLAPPNFGKDYGAEFNSIYPDLAAQYNLAFYPFFLEGVAAKETYNQSDGIHPNGRGVEIIVENIAPYVVGLLP
ncbi:MAG: GDSL-type esterase/lipase family protein, partial [Pseudomonadota bacterium]